MLFVVATEKKTNCKSHLFDAIDHGPPDRQHFIRYLQVQARQFSRRYLSSG